MLTSSNTPKCDRSNTPLQVSCTWYLMRCWMRWVRVFPAKRSNRFMSAKYWFVLLNAWSSSWHRQLSTSLLQPEHVISSSSIGTSSKMKKEQLIVFYRNLFIWNKTYAGWEWWLYYAPTRNGLAVGKHFERRVIKSIDGCIKMMGQLWQ